MSQAVSKTIVDNCSLLLYNEEKLIWMLVTINSGTL